RMSAQRSTRPRRPATAAESSCSAACWRTRRGGGEKTRSSSARPPDTTPNSTPTSPTTSSPPTPSPPAISESRNLVFLHPQLPRLQTHHPLLPPIPRRLQQPPHRLVDRLLAQLERRVVHRHQPPPPHPLE